MGSIDNAILTGYVCRLCSKIDRNVIHIYGEKGRKMKLSQIIKNYLCINVQLKDRLPKTVCQCCADNMIQQYIFIENFRRRKEFFQQYQKKNLPINDLLSMRIDERTRAFLFFKKR